MRSLDGMQWRDQTEVQPRSWWSWIEGQRGGGLEERGQLRAASCGQVSARTHKEVQGWRRGR